MADVDKRKEFMRAHGVEPGFLTGSWMEKFGTVEGDQARQITIDKTSKVNATAQGDTPLTADSLEQLEKLENPLLRLKIQSPIY